MSGVMKRMGMIFRAKANKALDRAEDPRETLDYSYQKQLELLQKVRRGVADVATSRKRLELQLNQLQSQSSKLEDQGRKALALGREDLAREALSRRAALQQQVTDLETQHQTLQGEEEKLTLAAQRLQAKVDAFRTKKETIKATYTAAQAQTRIGEAFSGISEEMGDVGLAIQRAEDKTAQLQARSRRHRRTARLRRPRRPVRHGQGRHPGRAGPPLRRHGRGAGTPAHEGGAGQARRRPSRRSRAARAILRGRHSPRTSRSPGHRTSLGTPRASTSSESHAVAVPRLEEGVVIVRIMGEGQVKLDNAHFAELNKLDDELLAEMESGDEEGFRRTLGALLEAVRRLGTPSPTTPWNPRNSSSRPPTQPWRKSGRC